jgi:hypothetical protein
MNHCQAMNKYLVLTAKIAKAVQAMDDAKKAFEILKHGPERNEEVISAEWRAVCKASGTSINCDFSDLCC